MEQAAGSGEAHPGRLDDQAYADMITEEARVWSENAAKDTEEWLPDWRAYKETWPYKTYRRKWTQLFFDTIPSGSAVLEIGCGVGWFAIELARRGCHVRALDVAEGTLAIAGDYLSTLEGTEGLSGSLTFELRDVTVAGLGSEDEYDFVVTRGVLHHLPDAEGVLQEIVRVLKPGGVLLVDDGRRTGRLEATLVALLLT